MCIRNHYTSFIACFNFPNIRLVDTRWYPLGNDRIHVFPRAICVSQKVVDIWDLPVPTRHLSSVKRSLTSSMRSLPRTSAEGTDGSSVSFASEGGKRVNLAVALENEGVLGVCCFLPRVRPSVKHCGLDTRRAAFMLCKHGGELYYFFFNTLEDIIHNNKTNHPHARRVARMYLCRTLHRGVPTRILVPEKDGTRQLVLQPRPICLPGRNTNAGVLACVLNIAATLE